MQTIYDVAIIGAGAVGAAIARELSRYHLSTVLVEAKSDVGMGTTKANTAIWHTGFDAKTGTKVAVCRGVHRKRVEISKITYLTLLILY